MNTEIAAIITGLFTVVVVLLVHWLAHKERKTMQATVNTIEVNTNKRLTDALDEIKSLKSELLPLLGRIDQLTASLVTSDTDVPPTTRETGSQ